MKKRNSMDAFKKRFPKFKDAFHFKQFNSVQESCFSPLLDDDRNMIVSAPTSSGKTTIFQLCMMKELNKGSLKCLYIAPIKALCQEKLNSWGKKFGKHTKIQELTSDNLDTESLEIDQFGIIVATPEKIDFFSRKNLQFLSKITLLLLDEVHMLNLEERGATLEAIVSRIMSLNNPRIIAVSATLPNIKEVGEWLKVPKQFIKTFGQQYRPVQINKVVLGFKSSNNSFLFQKQLNYKLLEVIRSYSDGKGALVFCQTQKGTESACEQLIHDMKDRQFITNDSNLMALVKASKGVSNQALKVFLPSGVAFHNAGLATQDRAIVERLFLESHLRVLCTTSTLSMGINLPARLVVIKSTQTYRGQGKGYQEYTQIEIDQMMGRAGRPQFDSEGTVVIMTEKRNFKKYNDESRPELLESHLYAQLSQHINTEISLHSIKSLDDAINYMKNSFCYIRMKNSPTNYKITGNVDAHIDKICTQTVKKLSNHSFIGFIQHNRKIIPKTLGTTVAKNSISIDTMINILRNGQSIKSQKEFLVLISESQQMKKMRNKLDERRILKEINDKNKYPLKNSISTPEKKAFVLMQCELDGRYIQNWELRKQTKQIMYFMRRLAFCSKVGGYEKKKFWLYYWSCLFSKFFTSRFWNRNQQQIAKQIPFLRSKWKTLALRGMKNLQKVMENIHNINTFCQMNSQFSDKIDSLVSNLKKCIEISYIKNEERGVISVLFVGRFDQKFKSFTVIVGNLDNEIYCTRFIKPEKQQDITISIPLKKHYLGIIKDGYIGFDELYMIWPEGNIQKVEPDRMFEEVNEKRPITQVKKSKKQESFEKNTSSKSLSSVSGVKNKQIKVAKNRMKKQKIMMREKRNSLSFQSFENKKISLKREEKERPLNKFNCWKPGFPQISNETSKKLPALKITEDDWDNEETSKRKKNLQEEKNIFENYQYQKRQEKNEDQDVYSYFEKFF